MGCNTCKKKPEVKVFADEASNKKYSGFINFLGKLLLFIVSLIIVVPLMVPATIIILFNLTVLRKSLNSVDIIKFIIEKIFKTNKNEEDEDEEIAENE